MRNLIASDLTVKSAVSLAVRQAGKGEDVAPRQLRDGDGLYLLLLVQGKVVPAWRLDYRADGKRKTLSLGKFPDVGLALARRNADEYRKIVAEGSDPSDKRKTEAAAQKAMREGTGPGAGTFEAVAREMYASKSPTWSKAYADRWIGRMEFDLFPRIGAEPIDSITPKQMLAVLRIVEARTVDTAHELRQTAGQVFRWGVQSGLCERDPTADLRGALKPVIVTHMAAITDPTGAAALMRAIRVYKGHPCTRAALELSVLLFQRPANMRQMKWADVDLDRAMWTIPSADMKRRLQDKVGGRPHLVPLPKQAMRILRELHPLTGHGAYCFPSLLGGGRPMSENTVNQAFRRLGFTADEMCAHGVRAMARTLLVERLNVDPEVVEAQLAHGKSGVLAGAYDRTQYVDKRRAAMQQWANYLDQLEKGGTVTKIKAA